MSRAGPKDQGFLTTYSAVCAALVERGAEDGAPPRMLRDPSLAEVSLHDVPRDVLLAIEGDEAFVDTLHLLFLDRVPNKRERATALGRLSEGTERDVLVEEMLTHPKVLDQQRTVQFR